MKRKGAVFGRVADAPFDMLIGFVFLLSSLTYLFGAPKPHSIISLLPHWLIMLWSVEMLLGSTAVLIGILSNRSRAFSAGMWLIAGASFTYGVAIMAHAPSAHYGGALSVALAGAVEWAIAGACLLRAVRPWSRHGR